MLVDSHCHLDFPEFAPELDAVVSRAQDAGVGVCVSIGTRMDGFPARARDRGTVRQRLVLRRRPSARGGKGIARRSRARSSKLRTIPRSSASARPGSTTITNTARAPQQISELSHPYRSGARRPACR